MVFYNYKAEVAYKQNREDVMRDDSKVIPLEIPEPTAEEKYAKFMEEQTKLAEELHKAYIKQSLEDEKEKMDREWEEKFSNMKFFEEEDESLGEPETAEEREGRAELDAMVDETIKEGESTKWRDHVDASRDNKEISK